MRNKQQQQALLEGTIKRHPDGFGFFIPDNKDHPDVYIPRNQMKGVFTNDKVAVEAFPEKNDRYHGNIVKVIERRTQKVAGTLLRLNDEYAVIRDDGGNWGEDLKIRWQNAGNNSIGKLVTAHILTYPNDGDKFEGEVLEVLGDAADPMNDIKRVIAIQQIPDVFPQAVLNQVQNLEKNPTEADYRGRKDLRGKNLITIDGKTAKDFDDAILVEMDNTGFKLYVAIADVSHYVVTGTPVDEEAYERGNSVYFPNFVVPMLPEILSNHLCSLNPHVPRLCVVAEMDFDFQGVKTRSEFYEAVMESKARVTYGEAQEVIEGNDLAQFSHVKENILRAADLAKVLMGKRYREGSLDLEIPETELIIDAKGEPVDVIRSERLFSHRLIEEMMLAANVAVAEFLSGKEVPAIYRIHEPPFEDNIEKLQNFITSFGGKTKLNQGQLQKRLTKALQEFEGTPQANAIHTLTLRSMNQAKYSEDNRGHFGLGFEHYTHFTSPIRRYSDLIVHRLLKNQILPNSAYKLMAEDDLATAGVHLSGCEQRAAKAERLIKAIKKARFLSRFLGESFEGIISSVTKFGIFVMLRQYDIDGLVRVEDLSREPLEFDEENLTLSGKRSGIRFQIGDILQVTVSSVDIELGQVNFVLEGSTKRASTAKDSQKGRRKERNRNEQRVDRNEQRRSPKNRSSKKRKDHKKSKAPLFDAREQQNERRYNPPTPPMPATRESTRREGGLTPEQAEEKLRKILGDPRFQARNDKGEGHQGKKKPVKKERYASSEEGRSSRKDNKKRGKAKDNRHGLRKARLSKRR